MCSLNLDSKANKSANRIYIINTFFLIVLTSVHCSIFEVGEKNLNGCKSISNSKSQSAKSIHCQNVNAAVNWKAIFIYKNRQDNLYEVAEKKQVNKNGCACSRFSNLEQQQLFEHEISNVINPEHTHTASRKVFDNFRLIGDERMILLNEGEYLKGTNRDNAVLTDYEKPASFEYVNKFYLDKFEVSNLDFSLFVLLNGHQTDAELLNSSFVFEGLLSVEQKFKIKKDELKYRIDAQTPWWYELKGTNWFKSDDQSIFKLDIKDLQKKFHNEFNIESYNSIHFFEWIKNYANNVELLMHPVAHVSWSDAYEYCSWAGKRLPTEVEWEYACKYDHKKDIDFPWGQKLTPNNTHFANIWQGVFPTQNTEEDGFYGTCPVTSLEEQNRSGFKHLIGNVWEWVHDDWSEKRRKSISKAANSIKRKIKKGGSFLCHSSYCNRYRCSSRASATQSTTASNLGFRCAKDAS